MHQACAGFRGSCAWASHDKLSLLRLQARAVGVPAAPFLVVVDNDGSALGVFDHFLLALKCDSDRLGRIGLTGELHNLAVLVPIVGIICIGCLTKHDYFLIRRVGSDLSQASFHQRERHRAAVKAFLELHGCGWAGCGAQRQKHECFDWIRFAEFPLCSLCHVCGDCECDLF